MRRCLLQLAFAALSLCALPDGRPHGNARRTPGVPIVKDVENIRTAKDGTRINLATTYLFNQLVDHNDTSRGTFQQRWWFSNEFYESGGPIVFFTPGEVDDAEVYTGYMTNKTISGAIAQQEHGASIIMEHRYYGQSNPFANLSVDSLRFHTIQQAIDDIEYFANNAVLPIDGGDNLGPDTTPWIMVEGSYSGALTSYTMNNKPGLFWAGYSSSGTVENKVDFWQYFEPERQQMAQNCSADVHAVIAHLDEVFSGDNQTAIQQLKNNWGLGGVQHVEDVAGALRNNLWDWQALQPTSPQNSTFYVFCDYLETDGAKIAPAEGFGLEYALQQWGRFWTLYGYLDALCGDEDTETCLGTFDGNASMYTDISLGNTWRSWDWIVCNEVGFFEEGPPADSDIPKIVSSLVRPPYEERQCQLMYPEAFAAPPVPQSDVTNAKYAGWNSQVDRLFFANGVRDPWRYGTVGSPDSPAVSSNSTPMALSDGFHCSDLSTVTGAADKTVGDVQTLALGYFSQWMDEYAAQKGQGRQMTKELAQRRDGLGNPHDGSEIAARDGHGNISDSVKANAPKPVNAWFKSFGSF